MLDPNDVKNGYPSTFIGQSGIGYKICDRLGAGSASIVFRCYTVGIKREDGIMIPTEEKYYAVKIIDMKSLYLAPDYKEKKGKLLEEVVILQKLRHPNIVSLIDYSDSGDVFFLVMDLVEGGELFYKIVESGSLSESSARYIMKQIADSLIYMHKKDIIHRDLKPENILIDKIRPGNYFDIKVADFGVAKFLRHGFTQARTLVGTPQYWAPEVIYASKTGASYGPEVDLWSLGVLFYVMLGGAFPFDERKGNLEYLIREGNYHFRYPRFKRVSDQAKKLIQRLLTVDPKERMRLDELVNDPWMNIKDDSAPISSNSFIDNPNETIEGYNFDREESVVFNNFNNNLAFKDDEFHKEMGSEHINSKINSNEVNNNYNGKRSNDINTGNYAIGSEITMGMSKPTSIVKNNLGNNNKTSSIMDLNGLLDLQLSVAYKLHGIYIAFRHNSAICRVLKQHIHRWRILQQQSCLTIGRFKQTCESVLDELPDFLLAVNTNEPKLAIELLSHVKKSVDTTQNDVESIQNGYNDFLFDLSIFVESIRDIKRITELSNGNNLFLKNSDIEGLINGGGVDLQYKGPVGVSRGEVSALANISYSSELTVNESGKSKEDSNLVLDEIDSNLRPISDIKTKSTFDEKILLDNFNKLDKIKSKGFDPSIFIGYNSARERVIRKITDLFSNTEIKNLLHSKDECFIDSDHDKKIRESDSFNVDLSKSNIDDVRDCNLLNANSGEKNNNKILKSDGLDSTYITTSLTNTRDLFLDFLFLPASICNVPPSGVESLLQENIDFSVPNINSLEISQEKLSDELLFEDELGLKDSKCRSDEFTLGSSNRNYDELDYNKDKSGSGYELCDYNKQEIGKYGQKSEVNNVQNEFQFQKRQNYSREHHYSSSKLSSSPKTPLTSSFTNHSSNLSTTRDNMYEYSENSITDSNQFVPSSVSISAPISPLKRIRRNENKLKISYILVRVLAQLRMIETILGRCVAFWGNMNIMIDKILQLRQNAEKLLGFTGNPALRTRFDERVESYELFWKELRDTCDSYLKSVHEKQVILEERVHELLDTASKVDTVFNMNFI
ncbi:protein kinase [Cryptosporidium bovis]|uniref:protein kinase n=1 Tax=Cryptosporidium bovis TaxID=310047 RepID=UPI00351A1905|nr:protein kinase [Cryptosporidium bovis]